MLNLFHLLVGLILPACGGVGAAGLPVPAQMDMAAIVRPKTPNTALAAPEGFSPSPDIVTQPYDVPPDRLFAAIEHVAQAQERVFPQIRYPAARQAHFVARSWLMNFPDLVTVQVTPDSRLILWSRSIYGESDLGVNRARLAAWLSALATELKKP